jgi:hypothetical protein
MRGERGVGVRLMAGTVKGEEVLGLVPDLMAGWC